MHGFRRWRLKEVFAKIGGKLHYLWRAVDHEGEAVACFVTRKRDKTAALRCLKRGLKRHGMAKAIVTDRLKSYSTAMRNLGNQDQHLMGGRLNNWAENAHLPFRRRGRATLRFRPLKTLQKFTAVHVSLYNHFNSERHLVDRAISKTRRSTALAERRAIAA